MNIRQLRLMNQEAGRLSVTRLTSSAKALGLDPANFPDDRANDILAHAKGKTGAKPTTPKQGKQVDTGAIVAQQAQALAQVAQSGATQGRQRGEQTLTKFTDSLAGAFQGAQVQAYLETVGEGVQEIAGFLSGEYNNVARQDLPESVQGFLSRVGADSLGDLEDVLTIDADAIDVLDGQFMGALPDGDFGQ